MRIMTPEKNTPFKTIEIVIVPGFKIRNFLETPDEHQMPAQSVRRILILESRPDLMSVALAGHPPHVVESGSTCQRDNAQECL